MPQPRPQRRYPLIRRQPQTTSAPARILATVRELVEDGSFHQVTVDEIALRAGVAKATLYQHFGSKLGLIEALGAELEHDAALGRVFRALALPDAEEAVLEAVARGTVFWASHAALFRQLMALARVDPSAFAFVTHENEAQQRHLRDLVTRLEQQGKLRPDVSADEAYAVVLLACSFDSVDTLLDRAGMDPSAAARVLRAQVRTILRDR